MTERDSTCGIDSSIRCDICNARSGRSDPREPWECSASNPKPTWRCDGCIGAVLVATEQRHGLYPSITFDNKEQQAAWDKAVKDAGWHDISIGSSIDMEELRKRRFQ
jgi:hypothetical protein